MANKKVCIFSAQYLPHMGGVERYTLNLCKKLIENGNEAVVVTSQIEDYSNYEVIYGSIGGIIVLITWLYLSSWSILIGLEVNVRLYFRKLKRQKGSV